MNIETGQLYEGDEEIQKAKDRGESLVKVMTTDDRISYANHLAKRRKHRKAARKANRKRRGRR